MTATGYDYKGLSEFLQYVKSKYPTKTNANVLLEPDVPYDVLVQMMDTVRVWQVDAQGTQAQLFPDISVGDAPSLVGRSRACASCGSDAMISYRIKKHRKRKHDHGGSHMGSSRSSTC